jgi:chromosomal replication initiator protein
MNAKQVWQAALGELQLKVPGPSFQTWLKTTTVSEFRDGAVVIAVPSNFAREWLEKRYTRAITETLNNILGREVEVLFEVKAPPRGESGRAISALEGVGVETVPQELPMAAGQQVSGPYREGGHQAPPPVVSHTHSNSYAPTQISSARSAAEHTNPTPTNQGGTITNLRAGTASSQPSVNGSRGPVPFPSGVRSNNGPHNRAMQMEMSMEEASMLNPRYVFDRFIVGKSNQLAHAACRAVAEHPAGAYNPLFLYGGVGLGKTHLLHAIGHDAMRRIPGIKVLYISSEKFTNDLINAIRDQRNDNFRAMYRSADILLIDDIQFIAGKESTQEEFFHTFNALHGANKQIVLSSDRPPKAILTLEERLRSRFEWGLIADIQPPDLETRTAILRAKAEAISTSVPGEVIDFIARKVQSNIRELEGALNRIVAYAQLNNSILTVDLAAASLNDLGPNSRRRPINHERIVETVSSFFNLEPEDLKTGSRSREVLVPRQIAMYLMREETETPFIQISSYFGKRDHTTAMHSYEKIEGLIETDNQMRQEVLTIRQMLYGEHER